MANVSFLFFYINSGKLTGTFFVPLPVHLLKGVQHGFKCKLPVLTLTEMQGLINEKRRAAGLFCGGWPHRR
jgi:hypothetical protein